MKKITLTQGKFALVNDEDFNYLNQWKWNARFDPDINNFYALRNSKRVNGLQTTIRMHRLIMNAPKGMVVDHINHNTLDNRKENLRICTNAENHWNMKVYKNSKSGYKGVHWSNRSRKWLAVIVKNGKHKYLGSFTDKKSAAMTYNDAAIRQYGNHAYLNFV